MQLTCSSSYLSDTNMAARFPTTKYERFLYVSAFNFWFKPRSHQCVYDSMYFRTLRKSESKSESNRQASSLRPCTRGRMHTLTDEQSENIMPTKRLHNDLSKFDINNLAVT